MPWTDRQLALAFTERYGAAVGEPYAVSDWPDDEKRGPQNRRSVDAIARAPGAPPVAIEITKIESFPGQREDDARIRNLEEKVLPAVAPKYPAGVSFLIPWSAYKRREPWEKIDAAIREYLIGCADRLTGGMTTHQIPGVPFALTVSYEDLNVKPYFGRFAPPQETRRDALVVSITKGLEHKRSELRQARDEGGRSVLVLEHHDIALISSARVYAAFFIAKQRVETDHLNELIFCRTDNPHRLDQWYCFLGSDKVLDHFNRPNFRFGPKHDEYWRRALAAEENAGRR